MIQNSPSNALILLILFILGGCATTQPGNAPLKATAAPASKSAARADIPPQLMYDLMSAEIAWQRGQLEVAAKQYNKAAEASNDPGILKRATTITAMTKDYHKAIELAKRWQESAPEDDEPKQALAMLLITQGETEEPIRLLNEILGKDAQINFMQVVTLLSRQSNTDTAMTVLDGVIVNFSANPEALFAYAHFAARVGNTDAALEKLDAALRLKKNWADAVIMRSRLLQMRNENEQAIAFLKKELKGPLAKNYEVRMSYARLLMNSKQMEEAREQFQILNKQHPDIPDVLYALGLLDLQTDHLEDGERHFKRLIELGERRMEASYHLGLITEFKQEPEAAIKWFSAVTQGQFFQHSQVKLASLMAQQGKTDEALELLHQLQLTTEHPQEKLQIILLEGEILYRARRYQEAYDVHDRALLETPDESRLLYGRAMAAERLDLLEQAEADLTSVLSREPNNVQALNGLGYTLADRTERYQEAYDYLQRAIELSPDDPAIIDSLGWVLYRMGRHQDAIRYIQRAYEALKDPEVAAHLGEVLWASGQHDKARQVWDDALQHDPDHEILLDTIKRFGQ